MLHGVNRRYLPRTGGGLDSVGYKSCPTVNVGYDNRTEEVRDLHSRVKGFFNMTNGDLQTELVQWQESPRSLVKFMAQFHEPY